MGFFLSHFNASGRWGAKPGRQRIRGTTQAALGPRGFSRHCGMAEGYCPRPLRQFVIAGGVCSEASVPIYSRETPLIEISRLVRRHPGLAVLAVHKRLVGSRQANLPLAKKSLSCFSRVSSRLNGAPHEYWG